MKESEFALSVDRIAKEIFLICGEKVMLDRAISQSFMGSRQNG
jgi:hypothetical protein